MGTSNPIRALTFPPESTSVTEASSSSYLQHTPLDPAMVWEVLLWLFRVWAAGLLPCPPLTHCQNQAAVIMERASHAPGGQGTDCQRALDLLPSGTQPPPCCSLSSILFLASLREIRKTIFPRSTSHSLRGTTSIPHSAAHLGKVRG